MFEVCLVDVLALASATLRDVERNPVKGDYYLLF